MVVVEVGEMRVKTKVGTLRPGHVFVMPLTRRLGSVAPFDPRVQYGLGADEAQQTQEALGVDVDLGPMPPGNRGVWADLLPERKALHPDVVVEVAVEDAG